MKRLVCLCLSLLLTANLLAGCQGSTNNSLSEENTEISKSSPADWTVGFRTGPQQEGDRLYLTEFLELEHSETENLSGRYITDLRAEGDKFYALHRYGVQQEQRVFLESHSLNKSEPEQSIELNPTDWSLPGAFIEGFDLTEEGFVFLVREAVSGEGKDRTDPGALWIISTDSQGALISRKDLTDMLEG